MTDPCRLCKQPAEPMRSMQFGAFAVSACVSCGFQQVSPEPSSAELEEIYGALYFQKAKYTDPRAIELEYQRRHRLMAQAGLKPGSGQRVLEIGCGAGQFIKTSINDYEWYGIDISEAGIAEARERLPELAPDRLVTARIEDYVPPTQIKSTGFDAIVMFDTIEHVYDPQPMLSRAVQWLKPGGSIILSTPDVGARLARIMGKRWAFMTPPEHLSFFTQGAMRSALTRVGLIPRHINSLGKYANVAFVLYKAGRVGLLPKSFGRIAQKLGLGRLTIYVPTGDVMYVVAQSPDRA